MVQAMTIFAPRCEPLPSARATKRKGGWRMLLMARDRSCSRDPPPTLSRLASGHLLAWAEGEQYAKRLKSHMADAIYDNNTAHPMVHRFANLGRRDRTTPHQARRHQDASPWIKTLQYGVGNLFHKIASNLSGVVHDSNLTTSTTSLRFLR